MASQFGEAARTLRKRTPRAKEENVALRPRQQKTKVVSVAERLATKLASASARMKLADPCLISGNVAANLLRGVLGVSQHTPYAGVRHFPRSRPYGS